MNMQSRNNPWGFQAQNWNMPTTRGPPPQQFNQGPPAQHFPQGTALQQFNQGSPNGPPLQQFNQGSSPQQFNQTGPNMTQNRFYHPNTQQNMSPRFQAEPFRPNCPPPGYHGAPPNNQHQMNSPSIRGNSNNGIFNSPTGPQQHRPCRPNNPQMNAWRPRGPAPHVNQSPGQYQHRPKFQYQNKNNQQQKKKNKKRDPGMNGEKCEFYCDVCDRGYKDKDKYDLHIGTHEKCPKEGCSYIAAGKLVQLHIKLQHNSGYAKKIWSLESQKDIEKWRQERKQNYPTAATIEKKKALLAEKIARGEVIEEKYFGKMRKRNDRGKNKQQPEQKKEDKTVKDRMNDMKRKLDEDKTEDDCSKEKQAKTDTNVDSSKDPLSMFFNGHASDSSSSDDDDDDDVQVISVDKAPSSSQELKAAGALGSLINTYVISDDESDTETPDSVNNNQVKTTETTEVSIDLTEQNNNTDKPVTKQQQKQDYRQKHRKRQRGRKHENKVTAATTCDKSLLEKLLAKEIRQERNKILQCVHYIVKNKFFDK